VFALKSASCVRKSSQKFLATKYARNKKQEDEQKNKKTPISGCHWRFF